MNVHVADYVRMRVYLCISTADPSARLTISSYEHHSLACLTKADGANADDLFMQQLGRKWKEEWQLEDYTPNSGNRGSLV